MHSNLDNGEMLTKKTDNGIYIGQKKKGLQRYQITPLMEQTKKLIIFETIMNYAEKIYQQKILKNIRNNQKKNKNLKNVNSYQIFFVFLNLMIIKHFDTKYYY